MKRLIIVALLCLGISSFAQEKQSNQKIERFQTITPQQKNENRVKRMVEELNLDSNQEQQIRALLKNYQTLGNGELYLNDRKDFNKNLKSILTPEQMALMKSKRR